MKKVTVRFLIIFLFMSWAFQSPCVQLQIGVGTKNTRINVHAMNSYCNAISDSDTIYQLMALVKEASELVQKKGEQAFVDFRLPNSKWRHGDTYIFVLTPDGKMLVHLDKVMEGKNQINLKDINGKPIVRGLIDAAALHSGKSEGWYHYQWPVPGGILPRWKSSYVRLATSPSGQSYIIGSGMYTDQMEREFVVDMVQNAAWQLKKNKEMAFQLFHNPAEDFRVKDAYVFVIDQSGFDLVNPGFPNLEGRNLMDLKDAKGKYLIREMFKSLEADSSAWVDYMWPKPGESISTLKSAYVRKVWMGKAFYIVGCGVYLADAPKEIPLSKKITAAELKSLVYSAAKVFEKKGDSAFPDFRKKGSEWYHDDIYFFVWSEEGIRTFHAADPQSEGAPVSHLTDAIGRPFGKMFMDVFSSNDPEAWVHYMYPEPGDIFPIWKSSFIKKVQFPSGKNYIIGCGIYQMEMDSAFIENMVNHAALLIQEKGKDAFATLRDKTGPFIFMDTYVFVDSPDGIEWVNPAQPSLEGTNILQLKDVKGKFVAKEYIQAALSSDNAWMNYYWYRPGQNVPSLKYSFVKKVKFKNEIFILGAGFYENKH